VTAALDKSRRQQMTDVLPELHSLMRFTPATVIGQAQCWTTAARNVLGRFSKRLGMRARA